MKRLCQNCGKLEGCERADADSGYSCWTMNEYDSMMADMAEQQRIDEQREERLCQK